MSSGVIVGISLLWRCGLASQAPSYSVETDRTRLSSPLLPILSSKPGHIFLRQRLSLPRPTSHVYQSSSEISSLALGQHRNQHKIMHCIFASPIATILLISRFSLFSANINQSPPSTNQTGKASAARPPTKPPRSAVFDPASFSWLAPSCFDEALARQFLGTWMSK